MDMGAIAAATGRSDTKLAACVVAAALCLGSCSSADRPPPSTQRGATPDDPAVPLPTTAPVNPVPDTVACPDVRAVSEPGVRGLTDLKMVSPDKGYAVRACSA